MQKVSQDLEAIDECHTALAACAAALPEISEAGPVLALVQRVLDRFSPTACQAVADAAGEPALELF